MERKKILVASLLVFVLVLALLNFVTVYFFGISLSPVAITGMVVEDALVKIYVQGDVPIITIHFPGNETYDNNTYTCVTGVLPKCNNYRYSLSLNVSANFDIEEPNGWKYSLYDLKHSEWVYENIVFTPNTSVSFVRWGNRLTVFAEEEDSDWVNETVTLTIDVPNSSPLIDGLDAKIFVCESERLHNIAASYFNVNDIDEDDFSSSSAVNISPMAGLFDVDYLGKSGYNVSSFRIRSAIFGKGDVGDYLETINAIDPYGLLASEDTNISVIEVNRVPVYENIFSQTIYMTGANSVFSHQMLVTDVEDGLSDDGNMFFNVSGLLDIDINSSNGEMNYVPQTGDQGGGSQAYSMSVCVTDNAISDVHENFSVCSARGHSADNITVCDSFTLTITNDNRPPTIDDYSPVNDSFSVPGTNTTLFTVEVSDADMVGFYPDIYWYVDGVLNRSVENNHTDNFSYSFGCGVSGLHSVEIVTSDDLANDSQEWNISVDRVDCPDDSTSSGGGGGGGGSLGGKCFERWVCNDWEVCQNAERSFNSGILSPEDYSSTKDLCAQNGYDNRFCGFQITSCVDLEACNNTEFEVPRPVESRVCYFTENPNCIDGITNCHDGACELLVDCGGPCDACPTCSDGKRNQGENGIDCGGPCPYTCEEETPFAGIGMMLILLLLALLVIVLFIIIKIFKILRYRFFLVGKKRKRSRR